MAKAKEDPIAKRINIKDIKAQLDLLTARLKEYECDAARCAVRDCNFVSDGLRLSQEVEVLQREIAALRRENAALKKRLVAGGADMAAGQ
jgi:hypothetical protein